MNKLKLITSWICLTLSLSSCKYTGEKLTPVFPDFSKSTVNTYKVKSKEPLEFELNEQGVPFSEVARRQINKEDEPLVCFPISQVQEMRRAWEDSRKNKSVHTVDSNTYSEANATDGARRDSDY